MRRKMFACALTVLLSLLLVPITGSALDTGMEGLWTGPDMDGQITLMLGSGGTYISIYETDQVYRQAGVFWTDQENMYLTASDGTSSTLQYGFAEGSLYLSSEGDEVELKRQEMPDLSDMTGLWVVDGEDGKTGGLIGLDAAGGIVSVDVGTGEAEKGIYLLYQEDILIAFQDGSAMQMGCQTTDEGITFTNLDTGETMTLHQYAGSSQE